MRDTRLVALATILVLLFTRSAILDNTGLHELMDWLGYALVMVGAFGRVWCTAYIGGWKADRLMTEGPYSVVRNPLYVFSMIAGLGVALMTGLLVLIVAALVALPLIYMSVVRREEAYLKASFGPGFEQYLSTVPRWLPSFALYSSPQVIEIKPRFLLYAFRDAVWLLVAYPAIELIEYLHRIDWLPTLVILW